MAGGKGTIAFWLLALAAIHGGVGVRGLDMSNQPTQKTDGSTYAMSSVPTKSEKKKKKKKSALQRGPQLPVPEGEMWDKRKLVLDGNGLNSAIRIRFEAEEGGGGAAFDPPGCIYQFFSDQNQTMSCLVTAGGGGTKMEGTKWVPYGVDGQTGERVELAQRGVYTMRNVAQPYLPLKMEWPEEDLVCSESERELPLKEEWRMYENVSLIWTWVNGSDPVQIAQRAKYGGSGWVRDDSRHRESDELRHSLRSYFQFVAPWHKGELLIASNEKPSWMADAKTMKGLRVRFVRHEEFVPKRGLPLFSANVLEQYLYRVPGLTEYFLFLNDDFFFRRPTHPCDFFLPGPLGGLRMTFHGKRRGLDPSVSEVLPDWEDAVMVSHRHLVHAQSMSWRFLSKVYGFSQAYKLTHTAFPMHRDCYGAAAKKFNPFDLVNAKFRNKRDLIHPHLHTGYTFNEGYKHNVLTYLLHSKAELSGYKFTELHNDMRKNLKIFSLVHNHPSWLAYNLNDGFDEELPAWVMGVFLQVTHPIPSPMEGPIVCNTWGYPQPDSLIQELIKYGSGEKDLMGIRFVVGLLKKHGKLYANQTSTIPWTKEVLAALINHSREWDDI